MLLPICLKLSTEITIKHFLIECPRFKDLRIQVQLAENLKQILQDTEEASKKVLRYTKKIGFYREI